ncbi:MAG: cytochrome b/b6 domain-containing protein [Coriobacteriia bacterium]|nr:cytochrome b/b6 domain-containing protein [Coriobacteriia bacterium]
MAHLAHYREAHPLAYVITHWINLISIVVLSFTGFVIHFPFLPGIMGICRGTHMFFAIVLVGNMLFRVLSSPFIKSAPAMGTREQVRDIFSFLPQKDNRHQLIPWIKYYLFFKKEHPLSGKYGVPQKLAYLLVPCLIVFIAFTGLCLWVPTGNWFLFAWVTDLVGGIHTIRLIHYLTMWGFLIFTALHIYLSIANGLAPLRMIFFWKEHGGKVYDVKIRNIVGDDPLDDHA